MVPPSAIFFAVHSFWKFLYRLALVEWLVLFILSFAGASDIVVLILCLVLLVYLFIFYIMDSSNSSTLQECLVSLTSRVTSEDLVLLIYLIMLCNVSTGEEQLLRLSLSAMLSHHLFPVMLAVDYTHAMVVSIHQLVPFTCVREILRNLRIGKYTTSKLREWSMHSIQQFIQEGPSLLFQIIHLLVPNGHRC